VAEKTIPLKMLESWPGGIMVIRLPVLQIVRRSPMVIRGIMNTLHCWGEH
jgi:hypothetical protein